LVFKGFGRAKLKTFIYGIYTTDLEQKTALLEKYGGQIRLNYAYGKTWVSVTTRRGGSYTSPMLTKSGLYDWLSAFERGIEFVG